MNPEVKQERLQSRLVPEMQEFRDNCKTLQLATINSHQLPTASYVPFAFTESGFFILVSDIAPHGKNLQANNNLSIMLIEDEAQAKHIFARKRLSFEAKAEFVERETNLWSEGVSALTQKFGEIIDNLSNLGDFRLYQIQPEKGRYVKGFGQAFDVNGFDMVDVVHLTEGHVKREKEQAAN
ncbi:heme utilization protein HutZ [Vibrio astriarenae]|uniref:Heme utilization protein HutZ n=1 Tax=Vibrio astriarenae TaxID=1481923 RepID=A0A7Z2YDZ3_9VIBR|nr:heme utilization protein HutZ [Vibrio astriarenae]QIA63694.1 heme utilization protein HutZ [Vibrio astriarenae]